MIKLYEEFLNESDNKMNLSELKNLLIKKGGKEYKTTFRKSPIGRSLTYYLMPNGEIYGAAYSHSGVVMLTTNINKDGEGYNYYADAEDFQNYYDSKDFEEVIDKSLKY